MPKVQPGEQVQILTETVPDLSGARVAIGGGPMLVRDEKALRLEEAIRKMTSQPATRVHLQDRGILRPGMAADVTVFDPATIRDVATFENPNQLSEGMRFVLVNGVPVIDEGKMTNALPGKVLDRR